MRASRARSGTPISLDVATAGRSSRRPAASGRSGARTVPAWSHVRSTASTATTPRTRSRRCVRSCGGSQATSASRTRRGYATGESSRGRRRAVCRARSARGGASACSLPQGSPAFGARSSSRADRLPPCARSRAVSPAGWSWRRASPSRAHRALVRARDVDELLVVAGFLERPGPELRIVSLDAPRSWRPDCDQAGA